MRKGRRAETFGIERPILRQNSRPPRGLRTRLLRKSTDALPAKLGARKKAVWGCWLDLSRKAPVCVLPECHERRTARP